jgi:hypothetical protein
LFFGRVMLPVACALATYLAVNSSKVSSLSPERSLLEEEKAHTAGLKDLLMACCVVRAGVHLAAGLAKLRFRPRLATRRMEAEDMVSGRIGREEMVSVRRAGN